MTITVPVSGSVASANGFAAPVANLLNALGYVTSLVDTTTNTSTGTTEIVVTGVLFNAVAGTRYLILHGGSGESSVVADQMEVQIRQAYSGSFSISGTSIGETIKTAGSASRGDGLFVMGQFLAPSTGQVAISITIKRTIGSGQVKENATSAGQKATIIVVAIGNS
jgi:hypothetical protein